MAGIAGLVGAVPPARGAALVRRMLGCLAHGAGCRIETLSLPQHGLHVGRVARPDEAAPAAPPPEGGRHTLLFCGEARLDTSVHEVVDGGPEGRARLLERYAQQGPAFLAGLNGLFAGVLVDQERGIALLFNDRFGGERLYWHRHDGVTYFASEAKGLLAVLPSLRAFDDTGVAQFLAFGSTQDGRTLFKGVEQLPGASAWTFHLHDGRLETTRYFDPAQWEAQAALPEAAFEDAFVRTFRRLLPSYLSGHERVGVSLTGGLDTRMIMACLPAGRLPRLAYTYAGEQGETLDCRIGRTVASLRGIDHQVLRLGRDFLEGYAHELDRTVAVTDGCAGALQAHELYFSRLARHCAPVRLTGNFGSEVLRDMSTLKPLQLDASMFEDGLRPLVALALEREAYRPSPHPVTASAFREVPWHLFGSMAAARSELTFRTPYLDNELVRLAYRAPAALRRSAAPALHLVAKAHPPLADIPTDRGVSAHAGPLCRLARRGFAELTFKLDYLHKEGLPRWLSPVEGTLDVLSGIGLLGLHKFLPYRSWFRHELSALAAERIAEAGRRMPYWSASGLAALVPAHVQGRANRLREIHAVLTLEAVDRMLIRLPGDTLA